MEPQAQDSLGIMRLEDLKVASPCHESWDRMTGDERARHCAKCDMCVYNLSGMTRQEALDFVRSRSGSDRTCIRFYRRFDGTVITRDCPVGVRKRRLTLMGLAAAGAGAVVGGVAALFSSGTSSGGTTRNFYQDLKFRVLSQCDQIGHKYDIPGLCNCPAVPIVMGEMMVVSPPSSSSGGPPPGTEEVPVEDPGVPPGDSAPSLPVPEG